PWPVVESFLKSLPSGSLGLDIGCGNGKYLNVNPSVFIIGCDMCKNLLFHAKERCNFPLLVQANALDLVFRPSSFDFTLSIAVIHHLSSLERRRMAIDQILKALKPGGKGIIFVWAWEQSDPRSAKKRKYPN